MCQLYLMRKIDLLVTLKSVNSTPNDTNNSQSGEDKVAILSESLGPGIIAGAADDDPSGIGTYSIAGAQFGTNLLWTAFLTWPLMAAVQMMCARIGMVTGRGLAGNLKKKIPRPILILMCSGLFAANTLNVGADLAAMADAVEQLTGLSSHAFVVLFAIGISWATIRLRYYQIARVLKWLALFLFSYVAVAFVIGVEWRTVFHDTFIPKFPSSRDEWATLVAILGTTISPYLFFWQASQEVEEEKAMGRKTIKKRIGATEHELLVRRVDVGLGTFFSNIVMYFIILVTAFTLHRNGITHIETTAQATEALRPLAGRFAATLYTLGLLGVGFLAIPTLTGSAAYALAETFGWRQGLDARLEKARSFYAAIIGSTAVAVALDFCGVNPVKGLYWTALVNGVLAPFLLVGVLLIACDKKMMHSQPSSKLSIVTVSATTLLMFIAALALFWP